MFLLQQLQSQDLPEFEYNIPLTKADVELLAECSGKLWLQAVKLSEDWKQIVVRLCEQNGARGVLDLGRKAKVLNMLEDEIGEAEKIEYSPFEIITLGFNI